MTRRVLTSLLLVSTLVPASPASAERSVSVAGALEALGAMRQAAAGGSLADAVRTAAALAGTVLDVPSVPRTSDPALPGELGLAVTRLQDAVAAGGRLARDSLLLSAEEIERLAFRAARMVERAILEPGRRPSERPIDAATAVDRERLYAGALVIASAVDEMLPALRRNASTFTGTGTAGCDLVDQPPALCVGDDGANTYTDDYALVIDLGGDDVHLHGAGSADAQGNGLPASVTIDVGGDDRYDSPVPTRAGASGAQGSGYIGGIGILLDLDGADTYRTTTTTAGVQALGQGLGIAGVGILADRAGNDDYVVEYVGPTHLVANATDYANGLSYSLIAGMTLVLETAGNDRYRIESHPTPAVDAQGLLHPGNSIALGYGYSAASGPGVFADLAGDDFVMLRATVDATDPAETRKLRPPSASAGGMGLGGLGGTGLALAGPGKARWQVEADVRAPVTGLAAASGGGFGVLGGAAGFSDAGGDDSYLARAASIARVSREVPDGCDCAGVKAEANSVSASASIGPVAGTGGAAVLEDLGGSDRYEMLANAEASATAHDGRLGPAEVGDGAEAIAEAGNATIPALGNGDLAGATLFRDVSAPGASDTYVLRPTVRATARATAEDPGVPVTSSEALGQAAMLALGHANTAAQADFQDIGGADAYTLIALAEDSRGPADTVLSSVLGSVGTAAAASFSDLDGGLADAVTLVPDDPVCAGESRTTGRYWQDCGGSAAGVRL